MDIHTQHGAPRGPLLPRSVAIRAARFCHHQNNDVKHAKSGGGHRHGGTGSTLQHFNREESFKKNTQTDYASDRPLGIVTARHNGAQLAMSGVSRSVPTTRRNGLGCDVRLQKCPACPMAVVFAICKLSRTLQIPEKVPCAVDSAAATVFITSPRHITATSLLHSLRFSDIYIYLVDFSHPVYVVSMPYFSGSVSFVTQTRDHIAGTLPPYLQRSMPSTLTREEYSIFFPRRHRSNYAYTR